MEEVLVCMWCLSLLWGSHRWMTARHPACALGRHAGRGIDRALVSSTRDLLFVVQAFRTLLEGLLERPLARQSISGARSVRSKPHCYGALRCSSRSATTALALRAEMSLDHADLGSSPAARA